MADFRFDFENVIEVTKENINTFKIEDFLEDDGIVTSFFVEVTKELLDLIKPDFMESEKYNSDDYMISSILYFDNDNFHNNQIVISYDYLGDDVEKIEKEFNYYSLIGDELKHLYDKAIKYKR